jgi:hypothetical protein
MRLCRLNLISSNSSPAIAREDLAHSAIGFGIVFGRLRRGYGAPWEKPIHLWQVERVVLNALANRCGFAA